ASTSSRAAICRWRPTARTTSPTRRSAARSPTILGANGLRLPARSQCSPTPRRSGATATELPSAFEDEGDLAVVDRGLEILDPDRAHVAHRLIGLVYRELRGIFPALV